MSPFETLVSPLDTLVPPLETLSVSVRDTVSPLETIVSPLETIVSPLETLSVSSKNLGDTYVIRLDTPITLNDILGVSSRVTYAHYLHFAGKHVNVSPGNTYVFQ